MSDRIILGSRSSALARLQTYYVCAALKRRFNSLETQYYFKQSKGDQDLNTPLWQMGGRGVFTRDLTEDLLAGRIDAVVHSYKDLEIESNSETQIMSVLPRADVRDLLLIKNNQIGNLKDNDLKIYSSSPRRQYNLERFLLNALPANIRPTRISFDSIRGNIQTRLNKFMELPGQGFVIAKAALDRILSEDFEQAFDDDYKQIRLQIFNVLNDCRIMVMPLSRNPCAPAQGAFALEYRADDFRIHEMALPLNHTVSESSVRIERELLSAYGGGCHQKIGAAHLVMADKSVTFLQGITDAGQVLDQVKIQMADEVQEMTVEKWPPSSWQMPELLSMHWNQSDLYPGSCLGDYQTDQNTGPVICTKTVAQWFELANKDLWVYATADGLGWNHAPDLSLLLKNK